MKVLLTGIAGFIGMHCAERLAARGDEVIGVDCLTPYYSLALKEARLARLATRAGIAVHRVDLADASAFASVFASARPDLVLHLAAQAGVRHSLENPAAYVQANLVGFANLLEACRRQPPRHLVYASSSSVYGANRKLPWSEIDDVDHPISLYAATKRSNELMAHVYAHLFAIPATGLRYFTVYGPWGRPDMSPMLFAHAIMQGKPIRIFNHGDMQRDFTYIDDIVEGTLRVLERPPAETPPFALYNIGNHQPVALLDYVAALETALGKKAIRELAPIQPGDVKATYADTERLARAIGFAPETPLAEGLAKFAAWFKEYHGYA
ncbi:MAG TPA: NAD-dependent epimerase/dehydratase family protein [Burkholderiales bacterium]|nr:NAD-dependent epimerase/dehydratase family protein [Burkholderiales bacterium]